MHCGQQQSLLKFTTAAILDSWLTRVAACVLRCRLYLAARQCRLAAAMFRTARVCNANLSIATFRTVYTLPRRWWPAQSGISRCR